MRFKRHSKGDLFRLLEDRRAICDFTAWNIDLPDFKHPLHTSAAGNSIPMLELLVEHGANLEVRNEDGATPPQLAAFNGHEEAAKSLLSQHKDFDHSSKEFWKGATRLQKAVQAGNDAGLARVLTEWPKGDRETSYLGIALWKAVEQDKETCAKLLLEHGGSPHTTFRGWNVFGMALGRCKSRNHREHRFQQGRPILVEMLLKYGANANLTIPTKRWDKSGCYEQYDMPTLYLTAQQGLDDLVRALLDSGADINAMSDRVLWRAVSNKEVSTVRLLLEL